MGPFDFLNHIVNLFVPALALAALAAALAKLAWRAELAGRRWWRLAAVAAAANVGVTVAGLVLSGRDGRMGTYAAMVVVTALALWWRGFVARRR